MFHRSNFQYLSLNNCNLGDQGFEIVVQGIGGSQRSEILNLSVMSNELTNRSIEYINGQILQVYSLSYSLGKVIKGDLEFHPKNYFRLKSLNISKNHLSSLSQG